VKLTVTIDGLRTVNEKNQRGHWGKKAKRTAVQRLAAKQAILTKCFVNKNFPQTITLIRIAPRRLDNGDNIAMALSAVRDGVAEALGINDGDESVFAWRYDQRSGSRPRQYGVEIVFEPRAA
jgi:hypothetical protein